MQTSGRADRRRGSLRTLRAVIAALSTLVLVACSGGVVLEPADGPVLEPRKIAQAATPGNRITSIEPGNPAEIALRSSQLFFESAQVVVLASSTETAAVSRAASVAITLGTPLLLTAPPGENVSGNDVTDQDAGSAGPGSLNTELLRLGTRALLTVGEVSLHQLDTTSLVVQPVPGGGDDLAEILGVPVTAVPAPDPTEAMEQLAALAGGEIYDAPDLGPAPTAYGTLPTTLPAERNERVTVFTGFDTHFYAGVATARAAGARVFVSDDPASRTAVVDHLAVHPSRPVVGLGEQFADPQSLQRMVASLHSGQILPSGAQRVFRANGSDVAVITLDARTALKEEGTDNARDVLDRARNLATRAEEARGRPSVAGVDVRAAENSADELIYWADQAREAGAYLLLRVRPTGDLLAAIRGLEELLRRPEVGVRIDTSEIDALDAGEINDVVVYLRRLVREEHLPQKLLVVDLGEDSDLTHPDSLTGSGGEVALTFSVTDGAKEQWRTAREALPAGVHWGVVIEKVSEEGEEEDPAYPKIGDVLGKGEADLMTYR